MLDEPFGALDVITRGEMQEWLLSMKEKMNKTVLLVTHDMDEAIYLSDRILILGEVRQRYRQRLPCRRENVTEGGFTARADCGRESMTRLRK